MRINTVLAVLAMSMPVAARLARAGETVPISYNAATDMEVRPRPVVPALGEAGSVIVDPGFGSRILRVTGPQTQTNAPNTPFHGPADAFVPNWNADGTMFWVYGSGGVIPFRFDASLQKASRVPKSGDPSGGLLLDFDGPFSYRKPNIIYGVKDRAVFEYDFDSAQRTVVFDAAPAVPGAASGASMPSVSDDDNRVCLAFSGAQGTYQYVAVFDRASGARTVLDTKNSRLDGNPTAILLGFGVQSAHLDRSGRYVIIAKGEGGSAATPSVVWDLAQGVVTGIRNNLGGTEASGFGVSINESGYSGSFYEPMDYVIRSLDPAQVGATKFLIDPAMTPTPHLPIGTGHFSWNNAQPETRVPMVGTHYRKQQDEAQAWRAWDDEIIAVATDGSSRVWRFAHHYSVVDGSDSWDAPRGSVSQDGRWYLFTSNWGRYLGAAPDGRARQDVFVVELRPQAVVAAQETAAGSAPPLPSDSATATAAPPQTGAGRLTYSSPSCGPAGGSTPWACGAWPASAPPALGAAGSVVTDPDTKNRVLRVTGPGSFGEAQTTAFKGFDGGWRQLWNATSTRFMVFSWSTGLVKNTRNWVDFNPTTMSVTAREPVPYQFTDVEWDQTDPDVLVGIAGGVAKTYNVVSHTWATVFNPAATNWGGWSWLSGWGGNSVCVAEGPQDEGHRLACYDRATKNTLVFDLHAQTVNGVKFPVYYKGQSVTLPGGVTMHTIAMAPDGNWLAIDTHGNKACSVGTLVNYASTSLLIDLRNNIGYEWNIACGGTHWAYGYDSVMMQSASPKWNAAGANGPCNSDARGIARRRTDAAIDSSFASMAPCRFFSPATWNIGVHLSWTNNLNDANANNYPIIMATSDEGVSNSFLWGEIAAMETGAAAYQARLWRFAQTWNDRATDQCGFLSYASPSVSRDGKWALFLSDWRGQTGTGVCTNKRRTDMFLFELK
jgi:hypothetical protein